MTDIHNLEKPMENEKVLRPSIATQLFLGIVWVALFVLSLYGHMAGLMTIMYPLISGVVLLGFIFWAVTVKICLTTEGVAYYSGFGRHSSLSWADIGEVTTRAKLSGSKGQYETVLRSNNPSKRNIKTNIKLFGKRDLAAFAKAIVEEAHGATVDEATRAMAQGQMPAIFGARKTAP